MKTELRADTRSGARRFWDEEVMWRANALYHNDAINSVVKGLTGSRMDDRFSWDRTAIAAASIVPVTRIASKAAVGSRIAASVPAYARYGAAAAKATAYDAASRFSSAAAPVTKVLSGLLFGSDAAKSLPAVGTVSRTAIDAASVGGEAFLAKKFYDAFMSDYVANSYSSANRSGDGAPSGAGDAYLKSQTNSVPAAISQDARVNRDLIRKAYREYDATTNKEAFAESLRSIIEDKGAVAAVKALNSADYYSRTHKGQPLSRLMNGLEGAGNETLRAQLQETLDKHNEAFKALSLREQLTGGM